MAITEEDVYALYQELRGEEFHGTYVDDWKSSYSLNPQLRQIIQPTELGQSLHAKLRDIERLLQEKVWRGFIPSADTWRFFVTLKGKHKIGDSGLTRIQDFDVFKVSERRDRYESGLGVSIIVTMESTTVEYSKGTLHLQEISSKPTLDDLHKLVVPEVASNWKSLARILGVKDSLIRIVAKKYPNDCVEACQGVLFHWLKGKQHTGEQDRTWSILLTALDSAGFVQLERELRRKYFQGCLDSRVPGLYPKSWTSVSVYCRNDKLEPLGKNYPNKFTIKMIDSGSNCVLQFSAHRKKDICLKLKAATTLQSYEGSHICTLIHGKKHFLLKFSSNNECEAFMMAVNEAIDQEMKKFQAVLEAALARGCVEVEYVKCVTLGPPEAGKTQLKSALVARFDVSNSATPLSTCPEVVVQRYIDGKAVWELLTPEKLLKSLHATVRLKKFSESFSQEESCTPMLESDASTPSPEHETQLLATTQQADDYTEAPCEGRSRKKLALHNQFAELKTRVQEQLIRMDTADGNRLGKFRIIHTIDSGGQPSFLDTHPVIASSRANYFLVYNMEEGLDAKPKNTYRKKEFPTKELPNRRQSNLDLIKDSLLIVGDLKPKFINKEEELSRWFGKSISKSEDLPVLLVATRKQLDRITSDSKQLAEECSHLPVWSEVLDCTHTGTKLFAVDSIDQTCEGIQSVRKAINETECTFKLPLPISWLLCQLVFLYASEDLYVLTYGDLRDICIQEGLVADDAEFLIMVRTFHLLGSFSFPYLDQEFLLDDPFQPDDKPVFTNPDILYREVTKVLEVAFRHLEKTELKPSARKRLTKLQSKGQLDEDTLGLLDIPDQLGSFEGFHSHLLDRLVSWGIAAVLPTSGSELVSRKCKQTYFIPSVLPTCDYDPPGFSDCAFPTLAFMFYLSLANDEKFHYVPRGIFAHLIANLPLDGNGYEILCNTDSVKYLFRDAAVFSIEPSKTNHMLHAYNVMVMEKNDAITISINPAHVSKERSSLDDGRRIIDNFKCAMEAVYKRIYCASHPVTIACECPCKRPDTPPSHWAKIIHFSGAHSEIQCLLPCIKWRCDCPADIAALSCYQGGSEVSLSITSAPSMDVCEPYTDEPQPSVDGPPPAKKSKSDSSRQAVSLSVSEFLKEHETEFFEVVNPRQSLLRLIRKGVITEDVKSSIDASNTKDALEFLYDHLKHYGSVNTLLEYCEMAIDADGLPNMQSFGRRMKEELH